MRRRVLYVLHNHPVVRPGGAEAYALELYDAMRASERYDPVLVARIGSAGFTDPPRHAGAPFTVVGDDPNQYFVLTEWDPYNEFLETYREKSLYTTYIAAFLEAYRPDVVHFQHTHFIGYDFVTLVRRTMPHVPIIYTLHEFLAICHRDGQMVRSVGEVLCTHSSPRRCNECFPEWSPQQFFLRERFIKSHLAHVDQFLAPSRQLLERYVNWGVPRDKIRFEEYGRVVQPALERPAEDRPRNRIAFFGQISRFKGLEVLLEAMKILQAEAPDIHLFVYGASLEVLPEAQRRLFIDALDSSGPNVTFTGPYNPDSVPIIMSEIDWVVVPSRWWENSPLVIQEAFMHGRPVICSDVGGMAEKVTHNVNGLHFTISNPAHLADTIRTAAHTPGLWERLREGIPAVYRMDEHVANLTTLYDELVESRAGQTTSPAEPSTGDDEPAPQDDGADGSAAAIVNGGGRVNGKAEIEAVLKDAG
jgi:glycosyltransferase involved in cell wall biosynthesis